MTITRRFDHLPYDKRPAIACPTPADLAEQRQRASMAQLGMPRICQLRRCRRRKRCLGPNIACAVNHRRLLLDRIDYAFALAAWRGEPPPMLEMPPPRRS